MRAGTRWIVFYGCDLRFRFIYEAKIPVPNQPVGTFDLDLGWISIEFGSLAGLIRATPKMNSIFSAYTT
jgi:hypothetical protein